MGPFLNGFVDELVKLAEFPGDPGAPPGLTGPVTPALKSTFKAPSMDVKKQPDATPQVAKVGKPEPLTTPSIMAGFRPGPGARI